MIDRAEAHPNSTALLVFLVVAAVYAINPDPFWSGDMNSSSVFAFNILEFRTLDLSAFRDSEMLKAFNGYSFTTSPVHGGIVPSYPVGTGVITFPIYVLFYAGLKVFGPSVSLTAATFEPYRLAFSHIAAATLSAGTVMLFFLIARQRFGLRAALVTTACLAFATMQWGLLSQSLFQQTPSVFVVMLAAYLLLLAARRPERAVVLLLSAGALTGILYLIRPTNLIFMLALLTFAVAWFRSLPFCAGFIVTGAISVGWYWYDWHALTGPAAFFQAHTYLFTAATFISGLLGLTFSPNAGVVGNSPVVLLALPGVVAVAVAFFRHRLTEPDDLMFLMLFGASGTLLASYALSPFWDGGGGYGTRYLSETMPIVMYFVNFLGIFRAGENVAKRRFTCAAVGTLCTIGVVMQISAIVGGHQRVGFWLNIPISSSDAPEDRRYEYMFGDPLRSFETRRWDFRDGLVERIWRGVYADRYLMSAKIAGETTYMPRCKATILSVRDKAGRGTDEFRLRSVNTARPYAEILRELFSEGRKFVYARIRNDGEVPLFGYKTGLTWGFAVMATTIINDQGRVVSQDGRVFVSDIIYPGETGEAFGNIEISKTKGRYRVEAQVGINGAGICGDKIELGTATVE